MRRLSLLACGLFVITTSLGCQTPPLPAPDQSAAAVAAIRNADAEWSRVAGSKDLDKTVSFYTDDALVMPPNGAGVTTKDEVRQIWKGFLDAPGFGGGWQVVRAEAAQSGEIGYASGRWEFTWTGADGKPTGDRGKFTEIWKKQSDGAWKCVADIWNSDVALPVAVELKKK